MSDLTKFLDPVQGLIEYVNDVKPYHTKVIESLVEYVSEELVTTNISESVAMAIDLKYYYDLPYKESIVAYDGQTVLNTKISTVSNYLLTGSPPTPLYTFNDTIVYVNGIIKSEAVGSPLVGDYVITGPTQITFFNALSLNDEVVIYTYTQWEEAPAGCSAGGMGTLSYDFPDSFPIVSPDLTVDMITYPAIRANSFILLGDQTELFNPNNNTVFKLDSFVLNSLTGVKVPDINITFTVSNSVFTVGIGQIQSYTEVYIIGPTLSPPATNPIDPLESYVALVSLGELPYSEIRQYSNADVTITPGSPPDITQVPDEGIVYTPILGLTQGATPSFDIAGDFTNSNVVIGDYFEIEKSSDNNGSYNITSISYSNGVTTFGVSNVHDSRVDGYIKFTILANVFIINDDYSAFFKQGVSIRLGQTGSPQGSVLGDFTVLASYFIDGKTAIRVLETIEYDTSQPPSGTITYIQPGFGQTPALCRVIPEAVGRVGFAETFAMEYISDGSPPIPMFIYPILETINTSGNTIVVYGDATDNLSSNPNVKIIQSIDTGTGTNNGTYTVTGGTISYDTVTKTTTFNVNEPIPNDSTVDGFTGGWIEGIII